MVIPNIRMIQYTYTSVWIVMDTPLSSREGVSWLWLAWTMCIGLSFGKHCYRVDSVGLILIYDDRGVIPFADMHWLIRLSIDMFMILSRVVWKGAAGNLLCYYVQTSRSENRQRVLKCMSYNGVVWRRW